MWKRLSYWQEPSLEDRIDRTWYDNLIWESGYSRGHHDATMYEYAVRAWIRDGGKGEMPKYAAGQPPRSEFKRLLKHYEKLWKRGER